MDKVHIVLIDVRTLRFLLREAGVATATAVLAAALLFLASFAGFKFSWESFRWVFALCYGGRLLYFAFWPGGERRWKRNGD